MKLKYQGMPMRPSGIFVKAFDGSRKSVIGEVDLPIHVGPHFFQINFPGHGYYTRLQLFVGTAVDT